MRQMEKMIGSTYIILAGKYNNICNNKYWFLAVWLLKLQDAVLIVNR